MNEKRTSTGILFNDKEVLDGDILAQHCKMVCDYTGEASISLNRLLICWNGKAWDVKCIDAMSGYRNTFWGFIPKFDEVVGNAIENPNLLPSNVEWVPYYSPNVLIKLDNP